MLERDVVLSKISIVKRCLETIKKATKLNPEKLDDVFIQDVFILNVQRSVQACMDMTNIIISQNSWKLPSTYKESFLILLENKVISVDMATIMGKMCGFRNIAVHDYQQITSSIMKTILTHHLKDFEEYCVVILDYINSLQRKS
jgi:uncharacterized protein YutE (UPF0331/DUF86 family)